jgi:cysteine-rich repeat protein
MKQSLRILTLLWFGCAALTLALGADEPVVPTCGNCVIEDPETCDDCNTVSGDGCSASCQFELGGPGCAGFDEYQEPFDPAEFGTARSSNAGTGYRTFSNFFNAGPTSAHAVRVWGIEIDLDSPTFLCDEDDTANFNVAFWGSSGDGGSGEACNCCNKVAEGTLGCEECPPCEVEVCQVDPFCCVGVWDLDCDDLASSLCDCCPGQDPGVCIEAPGYEGDGSPDPSDQIAVANDRSAVEVDTQVPFGAWGNVIQYNILLGETLDITGARWVSVERVDNADGCLWGWVDETALGTYDDMAYQQNGQGFVTTDQPFCVAGNDTGDGGGDGGSGDGGAGDGGSGDGGAVPAAGTLAVLLTTGLLLGAGAWFVRREARSR